MAKDIVLKFRIDGIDKSTDQVEKLKDKVIDLNSEFEGVESTGESFDSVDSSVATVNTSVDDLTDKAETIAPTFVNSTEEAGEGFEHLKNKIDDVGNTTINNTNNKIQNFGSGLKTATEGGEKAVKGLSKGFELLGGNSEKIRQVEEGLQSVNFILKGQAALQKLAFDDTSIVGQLKSLGALGLAKVKDLFLTRATTAAATQQAAATVASTIAVNGLRAALIASGLGAFLVVLGLVVGALLFFQDGVKSVSESLKSGLKSTIDSLSESLTVLQDRLNLKAAGIDAVIKGYEKQLELTKQNNLSIDEQHKIEKKLIELRQQKLQIQLSEITNEQTQNELVRENLLLEIEQSKVILERLENQSFFLHDEAEITKVKEHQKEVQKELLKLDSEISKNEASKLKTSAELTASKEFDLRILNSQTEKEREKLKLQRESKLEDLRQKNIEIQNILNQLNQSTHETEKKTLIEKLNFIDTEQSKIKALAIQEKLNSEAFISNQSLEKKAFIDKQNEIIKSIKEDETLSSSDKERKITEQKQINTIQLINFVKDQDKSLSAFRLSNSETTEQAITKVIEEETKKRIEFSNSSATGKFDSTIRAEEKKQTDLTKTVEKGEELRLGFIKNTANESNAIVKSSAEETIEILKQNQQQELALAKNPAEIGAINAKYQKLIDSTKDAADKVSETWEQTLKKSIAVISDYIGTIGGAINEIAGAIAAYQEVLAKNEEERLKTDLELFTANIDEKNRLLNDSISIQETIINDSQSRINSLEDNLKNSRGKRHEFLLKQIAIEEQINQKAVKKKMELERQEQANKEALAAKEEANKQEAEKIAIERKKREKRIALISAIINGAAAIINGFATVPFLPVGIAMGAAAALVTGFQIAAISSQQYKEGGILRSVKKAEGGLVKGKSHAEGGVKGTPGSKFGNVEVEGGEFITNVSSTQNNLEVLEFINREGKKKKFKIIKSVENESQIVASNQAVEQHTTERENNNKIVKKKEGGFLSIHDSDMSSLNSQRNILSEKESSTERSSSFVDQVGRVHLAEGGVLNSTPSFAGTDANFFDSGKLLFPDFDRLQNVVTNNNQTQVDLTPFIEAIRDMNIEVSVEEINRVNGNIARVKELARV